MIGKGALTLWPMFGAVNQLLAALALLVAESFLAAWFCRPPKAVKLDFLAGGGA